jgi:hypothetical protein
MTLIKKQSKTSPSSVLSARSMGKSLGRFKFVLKDDQDTDFNHFIFVDVMYIDGNLILHIIDEATRFQAAR